MLLLFIQDVLSVSFDTLLGVFYSFCQSAYSTFLK
jgi:hypothetical protein